MNRHPRIPGLVALLATTGFGLGLLAATGQFRTTDLADVPLEELEKRIVDSADPAVWSAYGDKLRAAGRFPAAAKAYERALALQPDLAPARLNAGIALGQANDPDTFFAYFSRLAATYPKLAVDLSERPELAALRPDPRWEPATAAARAQALD
jgi:tetratricopeptide (TPR) repeat protein